MKFWNALKSRLSEIAKGNAKMDVNGTVDYTHTSTDDEAADLTSIPDVNGTVDYTHTSTAKPRVTQELHAFSSDGHRVFRDDEAADLTSIPEV